MRAIRQGRVSATAPTLPSGANRSKEYGDYDLSALPVEEVRLVPRRKPAATFQTERGAAAPIRGAECRSTRAGARLR